MNHILRAYQSIIPSLTILMGEIMEWDIAQIQLQIKLMKLN